MIKAEELKTKFTFEMKSAYNEQTEITDKNGDNVFEEEGSHAKQAKGTLDVNESAQILKNIFDVLKQMYDKVDYLYDEICRIKAK